MTTTGRPVVTREQNKVTISRRQQQQQRAKERERTEDQDKSKNKIKLAPPPLPSAANSKATNAFQQFFKLQSQTPFLV